MKRQIRFITYLCISVLLFLTACIETEIIPEVLEPKLNLTPKSASMMVGQTTQLQAKYTDEQNVDRSDLLQWRSNTPAIAEVQNGGLVTAKAPGQAWIVIFIPGKIADSTLVTVVANANAVTKVEITAPQNVVIIGATIQFVASVLNASGGAIPGKTIIWKSSNTSVMSINNAGLASANAEGSSQITATVDGVNSVPFTVTVTSVTVTSRSGNFQGNMSYSVTGTATLTAGKLSFGNNFKSSNGPGLRVYLAKNAPAVLTASNSVKLGNLKNTSGAQDYDVPASVGLNDFDYAVIYCEPFNVPFGFARLN
ncbi:MAG: DM13 domain-containing protein [Saprospiraceae bacterium]|nr:DM13 domain-containing protein [Saprospiraceae bacterium]